MVSPVTSILSLALRSTRTWALSRKAPCCTKFRNAFDWLYRRSINHIFHNPVDMVILLPRTMGQHSRPGGKSLTQKNLEDGNCPCWGREMW